MTTQTDSRQIPIYSRPDIHGIDPLTGYFCSSIFVATLVGNNGLGPVLDLKLHYLPNQNGEGCDAGFGDWRFRFSHARKEPHNEEKTGKIFLNDAEVWKWDGQSNIYLPTAIIKNNASEKKLSIAYKNGQTEILDGSFSTRLMGGIDFNIYLPERIISPLGNELIIKWETPTGPQNAFPRLSSISDESKTLLSATYTQKENKLTATLTVFPDTLESYTVTFETDTETVGLSPNTPVHLKKTYNSKTDSTTEYSHETVVASKYQKSALIKKITYNSSATEDITYTEGKVSKHIITDSNKILVQSNAYTYKSNNGTLITSVTDLDKKTVDHHYTSNGLPIKEATFLNGLLVKVVEVERAEVIDKALQTSASKDVIPVGLQVTTTTTYSNASPFTRTERSVIRFDTLGNIISKTENGITTEWTYYQGMPKEEDLVTTKHIQSKGFFSTVAAIFEYSSPIGWGFLLFAKRGLTWGTAEHHTLTLSPVLTDNGKEKFNLPVKISCPGDPNYFRVYLESERTYTLDSNNNRSYLSCTYYGYSALPVKGKMVRGPAVKPSLKLTIHNPLADKDGKLNSWQDSKMLLEQTKYINDPTSTEHGRVSSSDQSILDASGQIIPLSVLATTFCYSLFTGDSVQLITTTTINIGGTLTTTQKDSQLALTGQLISSTDPYGNTSSYQYDKRGRLIQKKNGAPGTTTENTTTFYYQKNPDGTTVDRTNTVGEKTREFFDSQDRHIKTERIHPTGKQNKVTELTQIKKTYGRMGRIDSITENDYRPDGTLLFTRTRTIDYDGWGMASGVTWSDGAKEGYSHNNVWEQYTHWKSLGSQSSSITTVESGLPHGETQQEIFHSANGQSLRTRSRTYDANRRLIKESSSDRPELAFAYDPFGRPTRIAVGNEIMINKYANHTTATTASQAQVEDNLTKAAFTLGSRQVDRLGRVVQSSIGGRKSQFTYKGNTHWGKSDSKLSNFKQPHPCILTVTHDPIKNETIETTIGDAKPDGKNTTRSISYIRSMRGLLLSETDVWGTNTAFIYDDSGRLTGSSSALCKLELSYNINGQLTEETLTDLGGCETMYTKYTYDIHNREIQRTFECEGFAKLTLTLEYDKKNKISKMGLYQDIHLLRLEKFTYDTQEKLSTYTCEGTRKPVNPEGVTLEAQAYTYDTLGNLSSCTNTYNKEKLINSFTYDTTDHTRLNKSSRTRLDKSNSTCIFSYNDNGYLIDNNGEKLTYNDTNQLGKLSNSENEYTYFYNNVGQVVGCQGKNYFENFFYKGDIQYARESTFKINEKQINCTSTVLNSSASCLLKIDVQSIDDAPPTTNSSFEIKDLKGTVIASYDLQRQSITFFDYTPFGYRPLLWENNSWIGFNGQPIDRVSGCYHLGNGVRVYDPFHERFQSPDDKYSPFGEGGVNNRSYCHNDPVNYTDPSGHAEIVNQYTVITHAPAIEDPVVQAALVGIVGIVLAPFTGGASVGWAVAATGLAVASAGFGIASAALQKSDPMLADAFDTLSLGTGFVSAGVSGLGAKLGSRTALTAGTRYVENSVPLSQRIVRRAITRRGNVPAGQILGGTVDSVQGGMAVSSTFELYSGGVNSRILYIDAHGTAMQAQHLLPPQTAEFQFRSALGVKAADVGTNWQERVLGRTAFRHAPGASNIPNYILDEFTIAEHLHVGSIPASSTLTPQAILSSLAQQLEADLLRPTSTVLLSDLLNELTRQGFSYDRIVGNFCRGNMPYNTSEFEQIIRRTLGIF